MDEKAFRSFQFFFPILLGVSARIGPDEVALIKIEVTAMTGEKMKRSATAPMISIVLLAILYIIPGRQLYYKKLS
jgi:hypothetical protein